MIGFYNYTVILTYLSLLSAGTGIVVALSGEGHPYIGTFFLLFCGLCDAFDGKVARMKKNRSDMERSFGVQIDSLSDLVAFGVLPACIGVAMMRRSTLLNAWIEGSPNSCLPIIISYGLTALLVLYILAAMIRLAWFNVTEEQRQKTETGTRKYYTGLPVTSAALIFPSVQLLQYITSMDITPFYFTVIVAAGLLFLGKFQLRKPGMRGVMIMVAIGALEFLALMICRISAGV